jgi:hypothetical protein
MLDKLKAAAPTIALTLTVVVAIKMFWPWGAAQLAKIGL